MRKITTAAVAATALALAPCAAQAGAPVRPSSAVVAGGALAAVSQGVQSGQSSGVNHGNHPVNWAQVGFALGLSGTALAAFILLHKGSSSSR